MRLIIKNFKKVFSKSLLFFYIFLFLFSANAFAFRVSDVEITPQIAVSETYDDNISYASEHEQSDFITRISPGITAEYDAKDFKWDMYADITQAMFARNSEFDNTAETIKFNAEVELSKHDRISLSESFSHTYEPVSFDEAFGRTLGRYSYYTNSIVVEYIREINSQCSAKAYYGYQSDQFSKRNSVDSYMNTAGVQIDYALSTRTKAFILDELSQRDYEYGSDVSRNRSAAGIKQDFTGQLSCTAQAGIDFIDAQSTYTKPFVSVSLNDKIDESTDAEISYVKEYAVSQYQQDCFNSWQTQARFSKQPSQRLRYSLGLFYGEGKYVSEAFHEQFIGSDVSLDYSLNKNTNVILAYAFSTVLSDSADREYTKNKIMTGLRTKF